MKRIIFNCGFFDGLFECVKVFIGLDLKWYCKYSWREFQRIETELFWSILDKSLTSFGLFESGNRNDVSSMNVIDWNILIGSDSINVANFLRRVCWCIQKICCLFQFSWVNSGVSQGTHFSIVENFKNVSSKRLCFVWLSNVLFIVGVTNWRALAWRRKEINNGVDDRLYALVLERSSKEDWTEVVFLLIEHDLP